MNTRPDITLTSGTIVHHRPMSNGAQEAYLHTGNLMTEAEWQDYYHILAGTLSRKPQKLHTLSRIRAIVTITHLGYAYCAECASRGITKSLHSDTPDRPIAERQSIAGEEDRCDDCGKSL